MIADLIWLAKVLAFYGAVCALFAYAAVLTTRR